jgi:hypothetical protein
MAEAFEALGPGVETLSVGMTVIAALVPVTWQEIAAFAAVSPTPLNEADCDCLMRMSRAYCREHAQAENPLRIPPMERGKPAEAYALDRDGVSVHIGGEPTTD